MEDGEEEISSRLEAIFTYTCVFNTRNSWQEETKTDKAYLEDLKIALEETEDELNYFTTTHAELVGEVVQPLGKERFLVKVNEGVRLIVNRSSLVDQSKLVSGTRVTLERRTFTIMRILPPEVNPLVHKMVCQHDGGDVSYSDLGGLTHQLRDVRDWIERPLIDPDIFERVGVKPPKGVLLYGPPGTGKTLLAKAISSNINSTFLMVVSSSLVSKYVGESPLMVREMFKYAREHQPCIIFFDEIDAIGRRRSSYGEGDTRECDRVLIELLSQLDGFNELDKVKVIMATNRPDVLDPALLRPGRIDKKIEFSLPNEDSRMRILKIHASGITKQGDIDYEKVVKLSEGFNGADMRNVCTEAGMLALRAGHDYVVPSDFIKSKLVSGTRVTLERRTFTIMRILPPEVNPLVHKMVCQHDGGDVSYSDLGGLTHQLRDVRDWIERPLIDPDIFERVGVKPPKGVLLYGPPGTGKTLLAKAISSNINSTFLMVSDLKSLYNYKYVGESSLLVREVFKYAREHQPCIIFMDEIDAIGRRRSSYGEGDTSECDRVLIELLSQLDGFNELDKVTVIMATNRPDVLDPALLRPGRIDKKIEFSLPNEDSRMRIIKIHASGITKQGDIDYEKVVKLSEGFSGADMRNICTEAGMLALRAGHDYVVPNDFIKAVTKLGEAKKLESSAHYSAGF
ncbi:hypothetical protein Bca52824_053044 [Brassica carinata]|uniref:AAA+ ATPase domain-containing protein n=1 Tax=Brassica carinata TaxID=52824 RepID=A0A8X7R3F5_BRACI|nr:hypothetical protein Bca52824_053044 [Brassica carinata]